VAEAAALLQKDAKQESEKKLPFLSIVTFFPTGNPLEQMSMMQRQFFFESIMRLLHVASVENRRRIEELSGKLLPPIAVMPLQAKGAQLDMVLAVPSVPKSWQPKKEQQAFAPQDVQAANKAAQSQAPAPQPKEGVGGRASEEGLLPAVFGNELSRVRETQSALAGVINDYCRGDERKAGEIVSEFQRRLEAGGFKSDDLMAVLLLVIEDRAWAGDEAGIGGAYPGGAAYRLEASVPQRLREEAKEAAVVRLASVREMLRYYFEKNPDQYAPALAAALGITADKEGDVAYLQERLAYEIASIGCFALAQRILAKLKGKMGKADCMQCLGFHYDAKAKRLVVGKRTCVGAREARGILGLLSSLAKK
jgi:hypothetical protein